MPNPYRIIDLSSLPGLPTGTELAEISQAGSGSFQVPISVLASGRQPINVIAAAPVNLGGTDYGPVLVNVAAPVTINLPAAAGRSGVPVFVADVGGTAATNLITIVPNGAEKIGGQSTLILGTNYQSVTLIPVSGGWAFGQSSGAAIDPINVRTMGAKGDGVTDDTVAIQTAFNLAFGPPSAPFADSTKYRPVYFPAGIYIVTSPLQLTAINGALIYGAGRESSTIKSSNGGNILVTNGFAFCMVRDLEFITHSTGICVDLSWDGVVASALESNTFQNVTFSGDDLLGFCGYGIRIGNTGQMGSENLFLNCLFNKCTTAGLATMNANALDNVVIGGDFQNCGIGIDVVVGAVPLIDGVSFQLSSSWDIQLATETLGATIISGVRTESINFVNNLAFAPNSSVTITGCSHSNALADGIFLFNNGTACIDSSTTNRGRVNGNGTFFFRGWNPGYTNWIVSSLSGGFIFPNTLQLNRQDAPSLRPDQIADLIFWVEANDIASFTNPVASWNDKSGSGNNLAQSTSGKRPTLNAPGSTTVVSMQFTSANSQQMNIANPLNLSSGFTIFWVASRNPSSGRLLGSSTQANSNSLLWGGGPLSVYTTSTLFQFNVEGWQSDLTVFAASWNGASSCKAYQQGMPLGSAGSSATVANLTSFDRFGSNNDAGGVSYANMKLRACAIYPRQLTDQEVACVSAYFSPYPSVIA